MLGTIDTSASGFFRALISMHFESTRSSGAWSVHL